MATDLLTKFYPQCKTTVWGSVVRLISVFAMDAGTTEFGKPGLGHLAAVKRLGTKGRAPRETQGRGSRSAQQHSWRGGTQVHFFLQPLFR